ASPSWESRSPSSPSSPSRRRAAAPGCKPQRRPSRNDAGEPPGSPASYRVSGCPDLNWGPLRPERSALPGCATPRSGTQSSRSRHKRVTLFPLRCPHRQRGGDEMNSVTLTGNLATDVELREFGEDKRLATFLLAVDRSSRDEDADFF